MSANHPFDDPLLPIPKAFLKYISCNCTNQLQFSNDDPGHLSTNERVLNLQESNLVSKILDSERVKPLYSIIQSRSPEFQT